MKDARMVEEPELTEGMIDDLARPLVDILQEFYADPDNEKAFQEWQRSKRSGEEVIA